MTGTAVNRLPGGWPRRLCRALTRAGALGLALWPGHGLAESAGTPSGMALWSLAGLAGMTAAGVAAALVCRRGGRQGKLRRSRVLGCLLGGAAGDALGAPVEFMTGAEIAAKYGARGVTALMTDPATGRALVTDDTQMTLFTAAGVLAGEAQGGGQDCTGAVAKAYQAWYATQTDDIPGAAEEWPRLWLNDVPELNHWRAPGATSLGVLATGGCALRGRPLNDSRGCGGVMRVAPLGLHAEMTPDNEQALILEGAELAALTHGGALAWMPAGLLTSMLGRMVHMRGPEDTLEGVVTEALRAAGTCFALTPEWPELERLIRRAVRLAAGDAPDAENIAALGAGWQGHEALAIAVYCVLRHEDDFSAAIIAAVNHGGDSDSTGALTGQLLGAWMGLEAIPEGWTAPLEMRDLLEEIGRDLCLTARQVHRRYGAHGTKYRFLKG